MATGWNKVLEYAKMSENAYGDKSDVSPWEKVDSAEHPSSGYGAVAYYNPETGEVVIAHRGTTGGDDGAQDAGMYLFNAKGKQSKLALEFTNHIKANYPDAKITHTGHSLGGSIANYMAQKDPSSSAIAFDPLGTASVGDFVEKIVTGKDKHTNIVNYVSDPNIVNGGKPHAGKVIKLGHKNPLIPHPTKSHDLSGYIIPLIEKKIQQTNIGHQTVAAATIDYGQGSVAPLPNSPFIQSKLTLPTSAKATQAATNIQSKLTLPIDYGQGSVAPLPNSSFIQSKLTLPTSAKATQAATNIQSKLTLPIDYGQGSVAPLPNSPFIQSKLTLPTSAKATQAATNIQSKLTLPTPANVYIPRQSKPADTPLAYQPNTPTAQELAAMIKTYRPGQN